MSGGSIDPRALGQIFQRENIISEGSTISVHQQDVQVLYDTRLKSLEEMRNLPVDTGKGIHKVSDYSQVHFDFQDENEIVRIGGIIGIPEIGGHGRVERSDGRNGGNGLNGSGLWFGGK